MANNTTNRAEFFPEIGPICLSVLTPTVLQGIKLQLRRVCRSVGADISGGMSAIGRRLQFTRQFCYWWELPSRSPILLITDSRLTRFSQTHAVHSTGSWINFIYFGIRSLQSSTTHMESTVRFGGGTFNPRSVIKVRISFAVSGRAIADCTPTRTSPSA